MRHIRKGAEPLGLRQHRLTPHATYGNLPQGAKDELRERLAREQGFLCCYCMQRIRAEPDAMKIEHWASQTAAETTHRQLDWKNLLGACRGSEGRPFAEQHCDTRKGEDSITVNPMEPRCEQLVRFLADGTIESTDPAFQRDLTHTLNLNQARLLHNRKAVLEALRESLERKYPGTSWSKDVLERELAERQQPDARGQLSEYCQVSVYWLKKRLGRLGKAPS
jgi:uncharacterized protein (TIGR02646 family)